MSALTKFAEHCRRMASAEHKPECPSLTARKPYWPPWSVGWKDGLPESLSWNGPEPTWTPPTCEGCVTDADRALFAAMAGECATYLDAQLDLSEGTK